MLPAQCAAPDEQYHGNLQVTLLFCILLKTPSRYFQGGCGKEGSKDHPFKRDPGLWRDA